MSKMYASVKVGDILSPQVMALAKLGLSDVEIKQVLANDKNEKLFELSSEQKKASKQA